MYRSRLFNLSASDLASCILRAKERPPLPGLLEVLQACSPHPLQRLSGLERAVQGFSAKHGDAGFQDELLPSIYRWATQPSASVSEEECPQAAAASLTGSGLNENSIQLLESGKNQRLCVSSSDMRRILANMFLCNVQRRHASKYDKTGEVDFGRLYGTTDEVGVARVQCLLSYFYTEYKEEESSTRKERVVSFERYCWHDRDMEQDLELDTDFHAPDWLRLEQKVNPAGTISVHTNRMEEPSSRAFVDFANKFIHIHQLIPSATQEEVLFSCCPEAYLSILLCEMMHPNEIVIIRNVRRYADYVGYLDSFRYKGLYQGSEQERLVDILVVDALPDSQYHLEARDMNKAYFAYKIWKENAPADLAEEADLSVSTGHWGCGVFGGDEYLKMTEQLLAASHAGVRLNYSTYRNQQRMNEFLHIIGAIQDRGLTIADVRRHMLEYNAREWKDFMQYFLSRLE